MTHFQPCVMALALSFATVTTVAPAAAQGPKSPKAGVHLAKGGSKSPATTASPKTTGSPKVSGSTKSDKATNALSKTSGSAKSDKTAKAASASKRATTSTSAATTSSADASGTSTGNTGTTTGTESGSATTSPATTTPAPEPNAISARISRNPEQKARLTAKLPAGMTLEEASAGFRNQGQFIAAVNASRSENVAFVDLKTEMVENNLSLGQAVKKVKNTPPAQAPPPNSTTPPAANPPAPTPPTTTNPPTPTVPAPAGTGGTTGAH